MSSRTQSKPADFIVPLYMNGLDGRMLRMPPPKGKTQEIMYIYGHHSSQERNFGVAQFLNQYGGVTVPDLPGFGGMDPFYKIGEQPSLDNMADYLASFIKLRYKRQKFHLVGFSLGFMVVTRMLQKHPELNKQVDLLISFAGFSHKDDFKYKKRIYYTFRAGTWFFSRRIPAAFLKYIIFRKVFIKLAYAALEPLLVDPQNTKVRNIDKEERKKRINFEVYLWQCNDPRTYMSIAHTMFTLDLTPTRVNHKVYHISVDGDRYFDNIKVEEHMRLIFNDFKEVHAKPPTHAPSVIATAAEAAPYVPEYLRRILRERDKKQQNKTKKQGKI